LGGENKLVLNSSVIIETHNLSKTYGQFGALHDLSLSVHKGSVFALKCGARLGAAASKCHEFGQIR
jgi:ABC-type uncharacterized transport system ATPase subunit